MREQLTKYVELLFAGTTDTEDIRQEILQNTLDKYDDLVDQGKSPEAAYRLAISGIGDINEILGSRPEPEAPPTKAPHMDEGNRKLLRSIAIALYILCPVPLFLEGDTVGLCGLLLMVAIATAIMVYIGKSMPKSAPVEDRSYESFPPQQDHARKSIRGAIWLIGIVIYFLISFLSGAWYITWLMFLILPACTGLVNAILDLKEAE